MNRYSQAFVIFAPMRWKDYFYFSNGERRAIITLLILIVIVGGAYIYTQIHKPSDFIAEQDFRQAEFDEFLANIKEKEKEVKKENSNKDTNKEYHYTPYIKQPKLKEGETIELNTADTTALKMIPGIGTGYANRIVKYRNLLGGFTSINQLKEVWGMDDYLYEKITPYIVLQNRHKKINVNNTGFEELKKHPYINYKQAKIIVDIRERKGNIESIDRLALLEEFSEKDIKRLTPYLSFD